MEGSVWRLYSGREEKKRLCTLVADVHVVLMVVVSVDLGPPLCAVTVTLCRMRRRARVIGIPLVRQTLLVAVVALLFLVVVSRDLLKTQRQNVRLEVVFTASRFGK